MDMVSEDQMLPVMLRRQQFPLIPAYAMTINKSQGQTIDRVGIYLSDVCFSHGQLYVAMSRCRSKQNITVFIKDAGLRQGRLLPDKTRVFTRNVVFREVFTMAQQQQQQPTQSNLEDIDPALAAAIAQEIEDESLMEAVDEVEFEAQLEPFFQDLDNDDDVNDHFVHSFDITSLTSQEVPENEGEDDEAEEAVDQPADEEGNEEEEDWA